MVQKSYRSSLTSRKYEKAYSKRTHTLLNAPFEYALLIPQDVEYIKITAYEKTFEDPMLSSTCYIQFVKLKNGMKLQYASFALHKKIDIDDATLKKNIANALSEQYDIEDELSDLGFAILS